MKNLLLLLCISFLFLGKTQAQYIKAHGSFGMMDVYRGYENSYIDFDGMQRIGSGISQNYGNRLQWMAGFGYEFRSFSPINFELYYLFGSRREQINFPATQLFGSLNSDYQDLGVQVNIKHKKFSSKSITTFWTPSLSLRQIRYKFDEDVVIGNSTSQEIGLMLSAGYRLSKQLSNGNKIDFGINLRLMDYTYKTSKSPFNSPSQYYVHSVFDSDAALGTQLYVSYGFGFRKKSEETTTN